MLSDGARGSGVEPLGVPTTSHHMALPSRSSSRGELGIRTATVQSALDGSGRGTEVAGPGEGDWGNNEGMASLDRSRAGASGRSDATAHIGMLPTPSQRGVCGSKDRRVSLAQMALGGTATLSTSDRADAFPTGVIR